MNSPFLFLSAKKKSNYNQLLQENRRVQKPRGVLKPPAHRNGLIMAETQAKLREQQPSETQQPGTARQNRHRAGLQNEAPSAPVDWGCPSGSRPSPSLRWDPSSRLLCLPPLSLQLKVRHQPEVGARLPDGWNERASVFSCRSRGIGYLCVCFLKAPRTWVVGGCFGN